MVAIGRSRTAYEPSFGNDVEILDEIGAKFFSWCQRLSTPISTMEPILVIALRAVQNEGDNIYVFDLSIF